MPFEVFPVVGHKASAGGLVPEVEREDTSLVADQCHRIAEIYQAVADRGGEVVGSHVLPETLHSSREAGRHILFLVAKLPDNAALATKEPVAHETLLNNEPSVQESIPSQQREFGPPQGAYPSEIILEEWPGGQTVETRIDADSVEDATWLS